MHRNAAMVRPVPMLEKEDALPGSQHQATLIDGDLQTHGQERGLDMSRHIVWALGAVGQITHRRIVGMRDEALKKRRQISLNIGIRIFLNEERTGSVPNKERQQSCPRRNGACDICGDLEEPRSRCVERKLGLHLEDVIQTQAHKAALLAGRGHP